MFVLKMLKEGKITDDGGTNDILNIVNHASCRLIDGYQNVYALNGYNLPTNKDTYNKYLPYNYLIKDLTAKTITFVSPAKWLDPFEQRYYHIPYKKLPNPFEEPDVFCLCLTKKQAENEDAMWRMYAKAGEDIVKAYYCVKKLLSVLESAGKRMGFKTYIGDVLYMDKEQVLKISPKKIRGFSTVHYLTLLSIKRKAFKYENEVRIFLVPEDKQWNELKTKGLIPDDILSIENVTGVEYINRVIVSPYPKISMSFPTPSSQKDVETRKNLIATKVPKGIRVEASHLFDTVNKCKL